jgi:hypothetical protein
MMTRSARIATVLANQKRGILTDRFMVVALLTGLFASAAALF